MLSTNGRRGQLSEAGGLVPSGKWCSSLAAPSKQGAVRIEKFPVSLETVFYHLISLLKCFEFLKFRVSRMQCILYRMHFLKPSAVGDN